MLRLFELEDFRWLPRWYRDLMTDVLRSLEKLTKAYDNSLPILETLLKASKKSEMVDFGSGASGPLIRLYPKLKEKFPNLKITLTDLFPNECAVKQFSNSSFDITYLNSPVDMSNPPTELKGTRLMFTCFHHLSDVNARKTLQSAVDCKEAVGIFEVTGRTPRHLLFTFIIPLLTLVVTPLISGNRVLRFVTTYLIPIVPLGCFWDGFVSNLRTYSERELAELISELEKSDYSFETGKFKVLGPIQGTYLVGYPLLNN